MPEEHTSKYQEHELEIERSMRSKRMNEDEHTEEEHMESTTKRMRAHKKLRSIILLHTHKDHHKRNVEKEKRKRRSMHEENERMHASWHAAEHEHEA